MVPTTAVQQSTTLGIIETNSSCLIIRDDLYLVIILIDKV